MLRGQVAEIRPTKAVIDIGGVGYLVNTNASTLVPGEPATLYVHLAVRENALDLYGFLSQEELELFELLIELPKIGPKSALQILTQADVNLLKEAVCNEDPDYLSKLSGIGKKSAEKIVSGLKNKFESGSLNDENFTRAEASKKHVSDTVDALVALGYTQPEARKIVLQISTNNPEIKTPTEALKLALKILSR